MKKIHPQYLTKNEDVEMYKKMASEGMDLMHPVRIKGRSHRADINIPYHTTVKLFDTSKDKPEHVHEVAQHLTLNPPDPKNVRIDAVTLKGRNGNTMHVLKLHGPHAEEMKENHKKFSHLGYKEGYEFSPHITVDKDTWDHVVKSKAATAHEAGIEFMPAELHYKDKVVASYKPKTAMPHGGEIAQKDKLSKSIIDEVILMNIDLKEEFGKILMLNEQYANNYLQDNPELEKAIIKKYEERLKHHFGANKELIELAKSEGIEVAYESLRK
jgi:formylmethanofuran dehydrogenase subunit D